MAVNATAVWRVRTGGNNANGAGYDAAISGAGTDYSQQDTAQLTLTDIACAASTTVTSATGGFTSAMIGNAIWITGGGASAGPYFITARTDTNTITVDRTPGTVTNGTGRVGGAWANPTTNWNATWMVAGVVMYIRGSGSNHPTAIDYTPTATASVYGTAAQCVRVIGENGRPMLGASGTQYFQGKWASFENLVIRYTAATTFPAIKSYFSDHTCRMYNCAFDQNGYDVNMVGGSGEWVGNIDRCEFYSSAAKRSTNARYALTLVISYNENAQMVRNCNFHDLIGPAINADGGSMIMNSIFAANGGADIVMTNTGIAAHGGIIGCTFRGSAGAAAVDVGGQNAWIRTTIADNIFADHPTCGLKYSGSQTSAQATSWAQTNVRGNLFYNNGAHVSGFTLPADNTTGTNPSFTDASNQNFAPGAAIAGTIVTPLAGQTLPAPKVASTTYAYPGAVEPAAAASTTTIINVTRNYFIEEDPSYAA